MNELLISFSFSCPIVLQTKIILVLVNLNNIGLYLHTVDDGNDRTEHCWPTKATKERKQCQSKVVVGPWTGEESFGGCVLCTTRVRNMRSRNTLQYIL